MCGFDAAIDKKGPALNGAGPFCFLDYAENAGPLRAFLARECCLRWGAKDGAPAKSKSRSLGMTAFSERL
jgi:hypothetical protein